jgi:hypothetical protein
VLGGALPYLPSLGHGFTLDDANSILDHPGVRGRLSVDDLLLRDFWGRGTVNTIGSWRPVATSLFWLAWHVAGGRAWPFHAANVAIYAGLLIVADRFLARAFAEGLSATGRLAALGVFAALAIHADVVPSATGATEILAMGFALVALLLPLRRGGPPGPARILAAAIVSMLAIGSKESAFAVPVLVPVFALVWHARRGTARRPEMAALALTQALVLAGVVAFRFLRMPPAPPGAGRLAENPLIGAGTGTRLLGAAEALARYAGHVAWPARLAPDYSYAAMDAGHASAFAVAGFALAAGGAASVWAARRGPTGMTAAALGFGASYGIVSHVLAPASVFVADRLFFFPSFWLVVWVALAAERAGRARPALGAIALAFVAGQAWVAARVAARWKNDVTLLTAAIEARPTVARSRRNLAEALAEAGDDGGAAWQMAIAMAIVSRLPAPVDEASFPAAWEGRPLAERVEALRAAEGDAGVRRDLELGALKLRREGYGAAAAVADAWRSALGPAPAPAPEAGATAAPGVP